MQGFDDVFGAGHVFCPAAIDVARRWLPPTPELLTGGQLPFLDQMPCFCHVSAATDMGLEHLKGVGHSLPDQLRRYDNDAALAKLLMQYTREGWKIVASHLPYPDEFISEHFWVSPELVSRINNKRNLAHWVPKAYLPERIVLPAKSLTLYAGQFPAILKIATPNTTGGGVDVMYCGGKQDLERATGFFRDSDQVVVEEWIDFNEIWCLNYACFHDYSVHFLGAAKQLISKNLVFKGNQFFTDKQNHPVMTELGERVMKKIAASGYFGIVGLDMGVTRDNSIYLFDINCRMNASTTPLLALEKFSWLKNYPVQRSVWLKGNSTLDEAITLSGKAFEKERFLPLSTFDPNVTGLDGRPFVAGLLTGESESDISAYLDRHLKQNQHTQ